MIRQRSSRWHERRREATRRAEDLCESEQLRFPTNLGRLAGACRVKRIEFRPMLVDGALGVCNDGFEVFVGCESYEADEFNDCFAQASDCSTLPPRLSRRARFTIAHELAHTFFYDWSGGKPKMRFSLSNPKTALALERSCNVVAGALLLPCSLLERCSESAQLHDPTNLDAIANRALVSKSVLIARFSNLEVFPKPRAILMSIRRDGVAKEFVVDAFWKHYSFSDVFSGIERLAPFRKVFRDSKDLGDLKIFGGEFDSVCVEGDWTLSIQNAGKAGATLFATLSRPKDFPASEHPSGEVHRIKAARPA